MQQRRSRPALVSYPLDGFALAAGRVACVCVCRCDHLAWVLAGAHMRVVAASLVSQFTVGGLQQRWPWNLSWWLPQKRASVRQGSMCVLARPPRVGLWLGTHACRCCFSCQLVDSSGVAAAIALTWPGGRLKAGLGRCQAGVACVCRCDHLAWVSGWCTHARRCCFPCQHQQSGQQQA